MNYTIETPSAYFPPSEALICPPTPGRKSKPIAPMSTSPAFFPLTSSILGISSQSTYSKKHTQHDRENVLDFESIPPVSFTLKHKRGFAESTTKPQKRTICIDDLPELPFTSSKQEPKERSQGPWRLKSIPSKLPAMQRRSSLGQTNEDRRRSFGARCA